MYGIYNMPLTFIVLLARCQSIFILPFKYFKCRFTRGCNMFNFVLLYFMHLPIVFCSYWFSFVRHIETLVVFVRSYKFILLFYYYYIVFYKLKQNNDASFSRSYIQGKNSLYQGKNNSEKCESIQNSGLHQHKNNHLND